MDCSLKSDRHKYTPYSCVHIEVLHLIRRAETISLSHDRENLLNVQHIICWNMEIVWPIFVIAISSRVSWVSWISWSDKFPCTYRIFRTVQVFLVFFCRDASPRTCLHPEMHLFAILENSTLRHDCHLLRQVSLHLTNLSDRVLWVSPGFSTQSDSAQSKNLSRQVTPSSSSALTLPRSCSLLSALASFLPSFWCSWSSWNSERMADVKQIKKIVPLIACESPFCQYVCKLVFGVDMLDLNSGVQINLSNNQSRATLWVLDTCLIVGLRPLMIILITASLSSKMYSIAPNRENFAFDGTKSTLFRWRLSCWVGILVLFREGWFDVVLRDKFPCTWPLVLLVWFVEEWNTSITKSQRSRAGIPSMRKPASREIISASVELCETEVCFLHVQLTGTNVWLPKMHKNSPDVDFKSYRSPAKSKSWNNPTLHRCAVFTTWQYCLNSHVWWMYEIKRAKRLSHAIRNLQCDHTKASRASWSLASRYIGICVSGAYLLRIRRHASAPLDSSTERTRFRTLPFVIKATE